MLKTKMASGAHYHHTSPFSLRTYVARYMCARFLLFSLCPLFVYMPPRVCVPAPIGVLTSPLCVRVHVTHIYPTNPCVSHSFSSGWREGRWGGKVVRGGWLSRVREVERGGGGGLAGAPPQPTPGRSIQPPFHPSATPQLYLLYIPTPKSPRLIIFATAKEKSRKVHRETEKERERGREGERYTYMYTRLLRYVKRREYFFSLRRCVTISVYDDKTY